MPKKPDGEKHMGVYEKYTLKRTDGSHRKGRKHEACEYFVLDLHHDRFAKAALKAYAKACASKYPELSRDLKEIAAQLPYKEADRNGPTRLYNF